MAIILFEDFQNGVVNWASNDQTYKVHYIGDGKGGYNITRFEDEDGNDVKDMIPTLVTDIDALMRLIKGKEEDNNPAGMEKGVPDPNLQQNIALDGQRSDMDFNINRVKPFNLGQ
jgi:hypothetical protein